MIFVASQPSIILPAYFTLERAHMPLTVLMTAKGIEIATISLAVKYPNHTNNSHDIQPLIRVPIQIVSS